ncbi:sulfite exporter TauE/SafE family protein [Alkalicoccus daliensis]|uniref:Probable membrane transporter protein n=1 Tax=Alkalicoccus daliensis TaxID=745820 RepID=A0A1H0JV92_9BACI|nr:sulfite exporter TauE/SafE family protein [Alkalicoccus daliensis]SDO47626.1 hypothetical protein SAMN04488053_1152 [Alkalicoccus daliensis]
MSIEFMIIIFLIGFIGSFISGMVGIGGSIIKYPMLLYLPVILGYTAFSSHEVSGISAIQVFFATIAGVWAYRGSGYLNKALIAYMGGAVLIGSFIGGFGSTLLSEQAINIVYAVLATIAVIMMFLPKKDIDNIPMDQVTFKRGTAAGTAFFVGIASGIVGAAGAFILVPIMLVLLKIPTRMTIATSLAVTFISSIGATTGKIITDQILYGPAAVMIVASIIAAPLGARLGQKMNTKYLQSILALLILATAVKIWTEIF